ncbi:type I-C CRISPR-associated protein Cas5 [Sporanaerobium hydrogeniformans]|uniref:Type I-C CRISPR-associated protein Cas5 n=1 Tax=Sporanaerobium hydrogeniformans TaxID=3072179 RepID=A0AC61DFR8_9FIRM|nr:type I-C CRISPR-associated protein Cas5c [Sporanaerobium hydrogeniformans]PHV71526.1 type I-C CRISPR-associated protein Cas5 [Sporanaerobium hydrogeniformans]
MYGVKLRVWGNGACFTRPEMKVERVSYDVITPSAARGIIEAIHYKPAIRWIIDEIQVLKPITFSTIRRNEVSSVLSTAHVNAAIKGKKAIYINSNKDRQQRATLLLKDVEYIIKAHFEMTSQAGEMDTPEKHYNIFLRRARAGQCFNQPYLGCREFPAYFELVEDEKYKPIEVTKDLGWMLYDINFKDNMKPEFFRAQLENGVIRIPTELQRRVNS